MEVVETPIAGVLLIKPRIWGDARGYFVETWQKKRYEDAGITLPFIQDNHSKSSRGILRGLHFQKNFPQGKLASVSFGSVFDVVVDIRRDSPTFGQWYGVELTQETSGSSGLPRDLPTALSLPARLLTFITSVPSYTTLKMKAPFAGMIRNSTSHGLLPPPCSRQRT